jgi:hypothetical protein
VRNQQKQREKKRVRQQKESQFEQGSFFSYVLSITKFQKKSYKALSPINNVTENQADIPQIGYRSRT